MEAFEYNNFSEGERLRLDSAIMFAFRDLSKIQSSTSTNILILDEFDHGTLDNTGFESIVEILRSCKDENIFIISHSTDYFSAIADRNLVAVKKNNFSELKTL
jgi:energy-coupling factor transporter ATP-binding protein EcfA2